VFLLPGDISYWLLMIKFFRAKTTVEYTFVKIKMIVGTCKVRNFLIFCPWLCFWNIKWTHQCYCTNFRLMKLWNEIYVPLYLCSPIISTTYYLIVANLVTRPHCDQGNFRRNLTLSFVSPLCYFSLFMIVHTLYRMTL